MRYDADNLDTGIVISSRVRLARNLKKYPFAIKINNEQSLDMIKSLKDNILDNLYTLDNKFKYIELQNLSKLEKTSMVENHVISVDFFNNTKPSALLLKSDETISIMLNEEDHIRIQTVLAGDNIDKAWEFADKVDDLIEETVEYAYDSEYGYLTSCPTNVGTGMRASYMLHLPLTELTGQMGHITQFISKFGMTVRGIYGEKSEAQGGIYQLSNQVTLGKSEEDIICNIKNVTSQVIEQELKLRQKLICENLIALEDKVYKAYGIITNARLISLSDAMKYLSSIRLGYDTGVLRKNKPLMNIHRIMMNIQPANLSKYADMNLKGETADKIRAEFIRKQFSN